MQLENFLTKLSKTTKAIFLICFGFFVLSAFLVPNKTEAAFDASNIITDAEMAGYQTMDEQEIQAFLVSKGSSLATYTETRNSIIGPNNDVSVHGWKASKIIYQVSRWYQINPQVILVTLQKEESLITLSSPEQWRIDSAMGYGCPDSAPCGDIYKGFSMQVDWASWQLKWNMDKANDYRATERNKVAPYYKGNTISIDGTPTYLGNGATASLYRYTPHFSGNRSFYNLYTEWFKFSEYLGSILPVTKSLYLSNTSPAIGETVTASFTVKNNSSTSITATYGIANMVSNGKWDSFSMKSYTLAAGESKRIVLTRIPKYIGGQESWISVKYSGVWYPAKAETNQLVRFKYNVRKAKIQTTIFNFNPSIPVRNREQRVGVIIKNLEPKTITIESEGVPNYNKTLGVWRTFYPTAPIAAFTLAPNETKTINFKRTLTERGNYEAKISIRIRGIWYHLTNSQGAVISKKYSL